MIAGAIDALVKLYGLSPQEKGLTVAIGLVGTVIGALGAGTIGQRLGGRETLRITAILYVVSAVGCGLAWGWYSFMVFRFIGGLGFGAFRNGSVLRCDRGREIRLRLFQACHRLGGGELREVNIDGDHPGSRLGGEDRREPGPERSCQICRVREGASGLERRPLPIARGRGTLS